MRIVRRLRLYVTAKRCASSRARCSRRSPGERRASRSGSARPGRKTSSSRFARLAICSLPRPSASSDSWATESCPFPPSIRTRSGSGLSSSSRRWKSRVTASRIEAKSSVPSTVLMRSFRYSARLGRPFSNQTHEATVSVPCAVEMSKHAMARGTRSRPSSRWSSYTGSTARSSVSAPASRNSSRRWRAFCSARSTSSRRDPRCGMRTSVPASDASMSSRSANSKGTISSAARSAAGRYARARYAARTEGSASPSRLPMYWCSRPSSFPPRMRSITTHASSPSRA